MVLEGHIHPVTTEQHTTAANGTYCSSVVTIEVKLSEVLTKPGETASQHNFNPMHALGFVFIFRFTFAIVWQKIVTVKYQICKSDQADDDAHLAQFEHTHALPARFLNKAVNNKVGTCADKCTNTAKNGGIAQRNEELRMRQAYFSGPVLDNWSKDDHNRCVVEEGR